MSPSIRSVTSPPSSSLLEERIVGGALLADGLVAGFSAFLLARHFLERDRLRARGDHLGLVVLHRPGPRDRAAHGSSLEARDGKDLPE